MATALRDLHGRWKDSALEAPALSEEWRWKVSRRSRVEELARLLERLA